MRRFGYVIRCNLMEQQRLLRCGSIPLLSSAVKKNNTTNPSSLARQSINRTFTSKLINTTTEQHDDTSSSSSPIQGTIPLHGKGLKMGQYAEVHRTFTQEDVNLFGRLSGDMNPVHFPPTHPSSSSPPTTHEDDESCASSTTTTTTSTNHHNNKVPIVHGILLSSLFSKIFGTLIPGAIYRHQSLKFYNVVHVNECVVGRVVVTKLRQINRKGRGGGGGGGGNGTAAGGGVGGVLCTCDTSVIKMGVVTTAQCNDDETREDTTNNKNQNDGNNEKKEIVCISGEAQVWLPDLQLVYECREKE